MQSDEDKDMRMMLGTNNIPSLLIGIDEENFAGRSNFTFCVINGSWDGSFINGKIAKIDYENDTLTPMGEMEIICENQDRLRGDLEDVFLNFNNPNYVAPKPNFERPVSWGYDDNIPF